MFIKNLLFGRYGYYARQCILRKPVKMMLVLGLSGLMFYDVRSEGNSIGGKFVFSGTRQEKIFINNESFETARGKSAPAISLSYADLPPDSQFAVNILYLGSKNMGTKNENNGWWTCKIPETAIGKIEFRLLVIETSRPFRLRITNVGSQDKPFIHDFSINTDDVGKWLTLKFDDGIVRNLRGVKWQIIEKDADVHLELTQATGSLADGGKIDLVVPERFMVEFNVPEKFQKQGDMQSLDGRVILSMGGGFTGMEQTQPCIIKFKELFPNLAVGPLGCFRQSVVVRRNQYVSLDIPMLFQLTESIDLGGYLAKFDAFNWKAKGKSRNEMTDRREWYGIGADDYHSGSYAHPAMLDAHKGVIDALARTGAIEYQLVDAAQWEMSGVGDSDLAVYKEILNGRDDGFDWVDFDGSKRRINFAGYFDRCFGIKLTPKLLGIADYNAFTIPASPPGKDSSPEEIRRNAVFYALKRYTMLSFFSRLGEYANEQGVRVTAMPLNCSAFGQGMPHTDILQAQYVDLCNTDSFFNPIDCFLDEWLLVSDGGALRMPSFAASYAQTAKAAGSRIRLINESGQAGDQKPPYRDPRYNYMLYYMLAAALEANSLQCDFLNSWSHPYITIQAMLSPESKFYYSRFVDQVFAFSSFNDAKSDRAKLPDQQGEIVSFWRSPELWMMKSDQLNLGKFAWEDLHYPVEFLRPGMESLPVFKNTKLVLDEMHGHSDAHVKSMTRWLEAAPGRILVLTPTAAGHKFDGSEILPVYTGEKFSLNDTAAYAPLGITGVFPSQNQAAGILKSCVSNFSMPSASAIDLPAGGIYDYKGKGIENVLSAGKTPLLSRIVFKNGSQVYLLHYLPGSKKTRELDMQIIRTLCALQHISPVVADGQDFFATVFQIPVGEEEKGELLLLFDKQMANRQFVPGKKSYQNFQPYQSGLAAKTAKLQLPDGNYLIYNFFEDQITPCTVKSGNQTELTLAGVSGAMFYILPQTDFGKKKLAELQQRRNSLISYINPQLLQYLQDNVE